MKRFLAVVGLVGTLLLAGAPVALAAPPPIQPKVVQCGSFRTLTASGWTTYATYATQTRIERQYTPGAGDCNAWRMVVDVNPSTTINKTVYADFCRSGSCGFWHFTWPNYPMDNLHAYRFAMPWHDLTVSGTGCVWAGRGEVDQFIWAPYICV